MLYREDRISEYYYIFFCGDLEKVVAAQVKDVYGKSASKAHILVITLAGEGPQRGPEWVDAPLTHQLGLEDLSSTGLAL